jgi:hypothetical protein
MQRYLIEHRHTAEKCPAGNPEMAAMLAGHLGPENGAQQGVTILADCVHPGEHIMNVIVESDDDAKVEQFFAPFRMAGSVEVKPVITCEIVAANAHD